MSGVQVDNATPHKAILPSNLISTAKSIRNRRQVEYRPTENTVFSYTGNSQMIFNISSSSESLDGPDSYLQFKFTATSDPSYTKKSLNIGGCHNVVRNHEIRLQNGQLVDRNDRYNRLYAVKSLSTHSRDHVEWFEQAAGDSVSGVSSLDEACGGEFVASTFTIVEATGVITSTSDIFTTGVVPDVIERELSQGDVVNVYSVLGVLLASNITLSVITDSTNAVVEPQMNANIPAGSYLRKVSTKPQRAILADGNEHTVTLKLNSDFLMHNKLIPLNFMRQGLQIRIDLERPEFIMSSNQPYGVLPEFNYTIKDPIFIGTMVTLSEEVNKMNMAQFNDKGLNLQFMSYQHRLNVDPNGAGGSAKFSNNVGRRSARNVYSVIQPVYSEAISKETYNFDNTATFLKTTLTSYQYKVGAEEFPYREVETKDTLNARAFSELAITNGQHGGTVFDCRFCPSEWREENYFNGITDTSGSDVLRAESKHLILSTRLDRDNSPWTGVNTSINPLEIEMIFEKDHNAKVNEGVSAPKSRYIHTWVGFDNVMNISKDGIILYN